MGKTIERAKTFDTDILTKFLVERHIDEFMHGVIDEIHPVSNSMITVLNAVDIGAHLKSPRLGHTYSHHGIYLGDNKVIHYGGLSDGLNYSPVEVISLEEFLQGNTYEVVAHEHASYSVDERIKRAYKRIGEDDYSVIANNCEHFVTWCIYGIHSSSQAEAVIKTGTFAIFKTLEKGNILTNMAASTIYASSAILAYYKGEITREKLFEELNYTALTTASTIYYAGFGQVLIPIPIVGTLVGSIVGFFVGNLLYRSGTITLGESVVVNLAKERKEKIIHMTNKLIPIIQKNRKELETYIHTYFSERKEIFTEALNNLDISLNSNDNELFMQSLENINNQYGKTLEKKTFEELMNANTAPMF